MPTQTEDYLETNRTLVSLPTSGREKRPPVLCFLHGRDEHAAFDRGALPSFEFLKINMSPPGIAAGVIWPFDDGPPENWGEVRRSVGRFLIVSPQLPQQAVWGAQHARLVWQAVNAAIAAHGGDPSRLFLTGFSFGGTGALSVPDDERSGRRWAARWAVDPAVRPNALRPARQWRVLMHHGIGIKDLPQWKDNGAWVDVWAWQRRRRRDGLESARNANHLVRDLGRLSHAKTCRAAYTDLDAYEWLLWQGT